MENDSAFIPEQEWGSDLLGVPSTAFTAELQQPWVPDLSSVSSWETLEESGSVVLLKMTIVVSGGWLWSIAALWQLQEFAQSTSLGMSCGPRVNIHIAQRRQLWWMGQVWIDFWRPDLLQWRKSCRCGCGCEKTDAFLLCCGCAHSLLLVKGKSKSEVKGVKPKLQNFWSAELQTSGGTEQKRCWEKASVSLVCDDSFGP